MGEMRRRAVEQLLRVEWAGTMTDVLNGMLREVAEGRVEGDKLEKDFDFLRHLMGRREQLLQEIRLHTGAQRGPGTPGHVRIGRDGT